MSLLPPNAASSSPVEGRVPSFSHCPRPGDPAGGPLPDPSACENLLAEWFGRPVILLASGRSGLHLLLQVLGFNRYHHKLQVPQYLSQCVLNAVGASAFPVHSPEPADGVLFYHQYGASQRSSPRGTVVVEDIAHAFFGAADSGSREWCGGAAIFSLPKFFGIAGMGGGLIVDRGATEDRIREAVSSSPTDPPDVRAWMRRTITGAAIEPLFLESAYELLMKLFRPDPRDLVGFPQTLDDVCRVGKERTERATLFRSYFGENDTLRGFWGPEDPMVPFALPYFGSGDLAALERGNRALEEQGVKAGIYHIDIRRNMYDPEYRPCILIPCHQEIPMNVFEKICLTLRQSDVSAPVVIC